jgi:hypothetical protein
LFRYNLKPLSSFDLRIRVITLSGRALSWHCLAKTVRVLCRRFSTRVFTTCLHTWWPIPPKFCMNLFCWIKLWVLTILL